MIEAYLNLLIGLAALWAALGLAGLVIGVLTFNLDPTLRSGFWAAVFGPIVLIAVIDAIIRGEDV